MNKKEWAKLYREKNKEKIRAYKKEYYRKNKDKIKAKSKKYYKAYYEKNKTKIIAKQRERNKLIKPINPSVKAQLDFLKDMFNV
jgi:hypothetical protein